MSEDLRVGQALACQIDRQVAALVETAEPPAEPAPGWEQRALAAMEAARPGRGPWGRRIAVAAFAVAVVAAGIAFIPGRSRGARRDWGAAFATAQAAKTLHITGRVWTEDGAYEFNEWFSKDGFYRCDYSQDGDTRYVWMNDRSRRQVHPEREASSRFPFQIQPGGGGSWLYAPRMLGSSRYGPRGPSNVLPDMPAQVPSDRLLEESLSGFGRSPEMSGASVDIRERTEYRAGRRPERVLEARGHVPAYIVNSDGKWGPGTKWDDFRITAEVDRQTGLLSSVTEEWLRGGRWRLVYEADTLAWDVPIPEEVREPSPPPGHVLVVDHWWDRLDETVATATSQDWEVTLHALDVNEKGDLFVTLSRRPKPGSPLWDYADGFTAFGVSAQDDSGTGYVLASPQGIDTLHEVDASGHCFPGPAIWAPMDSQVRVRLYRGEGAASRPRTVSITLDMDSPPRPQARQQVVFSSVPVPPRQTGDDLWQKAVETVQY